MAYDVGRQRVVLFGGADGVGVPFSDTWEWDGSSWVQRAPVSNPSARFGHAMAYDFARQRVALFGGENFPKHLSDTWEWDGSGWTQLPVAGPSGRYQHAMAYDGARQRLVVHGGIGGDHHTWVYGPLTPAASQPIGTACAGSNTRPVLGSRLPHLGNPAFALELVSARPSSACLFGLSLGTQSLPVGPCTLHLTTPILTEVAATNWAGFAETPRLALPLDITLRGTTLYAQAFIADPQGPVLGLSFSGGLKLVLGD
jgi:hypothetical protein